jgi:cytochrome c oxidase cbb3-type subunit III
LAPDETQAPWRAIDPVASRRIFFAMLTLMAGGAIAYSVLRKSAGPPPAEIAGDALLVEGRTIYLARCVSCHGASGKGDGPIAKGITGPPPGDLAVRSWKHGDRPEQILNVVTRGVPGTSMSPWKDVLDARERRAVSAYVYYLAGRPVPGELRGP